MAAPTSRVAYVWRSAVGWMMVWELTQDDAKGLAGIETWWCFADLRGIAVSSFSRRLGLGTHGSVYISSQQNIMLQPSKAKEPASTCRRGRGKGLQDYAQPSGFDFYQGNGMSGVDAFVSWRFSGYS